MNTMQIFNLVYKVKKSKNWEKRCGGSSSNGIYLNNKRFLKPLLGFKYVNPLHSNNLNTWAKDDRRFCIFYISRTVQMSFIDNIHVLYKLKLWYW